MKRATVKQFTNWIQVHLDSYLEASPDHIKARVFAQQVARVFANDILNRAVTIGYKATVRKASKTGRKRKDAV